MIIVLTGAPGAGKGTQAQLLAERNGFRKISTGDALRNQIKLGTEVGKKAQTYVKDGKLVPDEVLVKVLAAELGSSSKEKILLDGYPRNVNQAKTLEEIAGDHTIKAAVHLDVDRETLIERISGRRICGNCGANYHFAYSPPKKQGVCDKCAGNLIQRDDDSESKVKVRLDVYEKETRPILDFYRKKNLYHRVDGEGETEQVFQALKREIDKALGN